MYFMLTSSRRTWEDEDIKPNNGEHYQRVFFSRCLYKRREEIPYVMGGRLKLCQ
jgi:hypothetical protein